MMIRELGGARSLGTWLEVPKKVGHGPQSALPRRQVKEVTMGPRPCRAMQAPWASLC
uniref:Uncharacterized protein n=1 Tax=Nelumbo nucifera TaxID=4432 RepID=A0A822YEZ8_NELNU|nr:TPA_asm: hypothetical protein HUJ06_030993 [Nelumbo nucifera]